IYILYLYSINYFYFFLFFFFFFSSRRRHTRCLSDWSSDVCSSDLGQKCSALSRIYIDNSVADALIDSLLEKISALTIGDPSRQRSEERRVGKECRSWWWPYD